MREEEPEFDAGKCPAVLKSPMHDIHNWDGGRSNEGWLPADHGPRRQRPKVGKRRASCSVVHFW